MSLPELPERVFYAIGVANYEEAQFNSDAVQADVLGQRVVQSLQKVTGILRSMTYASAQADPGYLLDPTSAEAVGLLRRASSSANTVIVYHCGHGEHLPPDGFYLCTKDFRFADRPDTGVRGRDLPPLLVERSATGDVAIPQHPTLLILDCCFAGAAAEDIMRDILESKIHPQLWVWATAGARQYAVAGRFAAALERVLRDPPVGPSAPTISMDSILDAVNEALASEEQQVHVYSPIGYTGIPPFFPNPRHARGVSGLTVSQQHWTISASTGTAAPANAGIYLSGQTGRRRAARDIAAWIMDPTRGALGAVTGRPGTGKSTMLALPILLTGPSRSALLNSAPATSLLHEVANIVPKEIRLISIYARGLEIEQVVAEIASDLGLPGDLLTVAALRQSLETSPRQATIVVDAVDESSTPELLRDELLLPLAREHGLRVLLGLRLPLPTAVIADLTVDLDSSEYRDPEALVEYASNILVAASEPSVTTPYRGLGLADETVRNVARAIADAATFADGAESFLITQAFAVALRGRTQQVADDDIGWKLAVPAGLDEAFTEDLNRFGDRTDTITVLLEALAWSKGPGLPWETIWAPVAQRLSALHADRSEVTPTDSDIGWLLAQVGYFIVEDSGPGTSSVFRPFHERFAAYLRERLVPASGDAAATAALREVQATVTAALVAALTEGGQRRWSRAHPYLRTYLAEHARDAGTEVFELLLKDVGFLAAADPATLTALMSSTSPSQREIARMYLRCRQLFGLNVAVNAAYLLEAVKALGTRGVSLAGSDITPIYSTVLVDVYPDRSLMSFRYSPQVLTLAFGRLVDAGPLVLAATNCFQRTRAWNVDTGEPVAVGIRLVPQYAAPVALSQLPEGQMVFAAGSPNGSTELLDALTGALITATPQTGVAAVVVAFEASLTSPALFLVAYEDAAAQLFSAPGGERVGPQIPILPGRSVAVARSEDHLLVASGDNGGNVLVSDGRTGRIVSQFSVRDRREVSAIGFGFATDGALILATGHGDGVVQLWDPFSGDSICTPLVGHGGRIMSLAFGRLTPDRSVVASGSYDKTIRVWDTTTGAQIHDPLIGHSGPVMAVTFGVTEAGDTLLASAGGDNAVRVWGPLVADLTPTHFEDIPHGIPSVDAVALGASKRVPQLAAFSRYSVLRLRDLSDSAWAEELHYRGKITSVAVGSSTQRNAYVAVAGRAGIDLWDVDERRPVATLPHRGIVHDLAFGPENSTRLLVAVSLEGLLRAWSINDRARVSAVLLSYNGEPPTAATVTPSPPGRELIVIGDETGTVTLWDPRSDQQVEQYRAHDSRIAAVAAGNSATGSVLIASAGRDDILLRDLESGAMPLRIGQPLGVSALGFGAAPDRRPLIISANQAGRLEIWDIENQTRAVNLVRRTGIHSIAAEGLRLAVGDRESFAVIDIDDRAV